MAEIIPTEYGPVSRATLDKASKCASLPNHLFLEAAKQATHVIDFVERLAEMGDWDAKELEEYYREHPGARLEAEKEKARGHGFGSDG